MANIKEFKKGSSVKLTANFSSHEWDCNCTYADCTTTLIDVDHVARLQSMRDKWGKTVHINSGYRCPKRNWDEGGVTGSRHKVGDATDIVVDGMTPDQVADDCDSIFNGLGRYGIFTHVDSRPGAKSRWDFRGTKAPK